MPMRYQVDDAQNMIVKELIEKDFEWLLLIEHDVILPNEAFIRFNDYMLSEEYPIVSGLYFTRFRPSEPLVYRGRGNSFYSDFEIGDRVMCDGVPTGCLLIHQSILRVLWDESEEYQVGKQFTRRVFNTPRKTWYDPETGYQNSTTGTSDLDWCTRLMKDDIFKKAGWEKFQEMEFPFLCDTSIFCKHINPNGEQFP